ncbi:hypothetical protein M569_05065, partial [Genlisea aurea]
MESNKGEATRAKALAEKQFVEKNFQAAKKYALKAQSLCPELEGISQMVATFSVYVASEKKINGELDFYSILGVDPSVDKSKLKKQYKKLAVLLHPDKNRTVGADGAFKLVSEAWTLLSDSYKRNAYDQQKNWRCDEFDDFYKYHHPPPSSHSRLDTFWTVCTSCHVQYEYLRKYVNKRLSCKNCRGVFIAVETGIAPYSNYSHVPENGYGNHGGYGFSFMRASAGYCTPSVSSGHHHSGNISFQGKLSGVVDSHAAAYRQYSGDADKVKKPNGYNHHDHGCYRGTNEISKPKRGRPSKKRKVDIAASSSVHGREETAAGELNTAVVQGNVAPSKTGSRLPSPPSIALDIRQLLIEKARSEICKKLEEMKLISEATVVTEGGKRNSGACDEKREAEHRKSSSTSISVPDSDFHDFDRDRSEECFRPRQIWAVYDEDGMPRLYCLIREVISLDPFKIYIGYLSSKSDSEFGSVKWVESGFTKSCGSFRVFHSETVEQVNIFSHVLSREKVGRGGCVRIYPKSGDIWAIYRNWSSDWDGTTPEQVRHQYEMVQVVDDYSEEKGVWVVPLVKLNGFKTVYQRDSNKDAIRWIPRREMLRFSHQVPACSLKVEQGTTDLLPEGCWDLDPAATPDQLLQ